MLKIFMTLVLPLFISNYYTRTPIIPVHYVYYEEFEFLSVRYATFEANDGWMGGWDGWTNANRQSRPTTFVKNIITEELQHHHDINKE
jgi:hypothetical protein